MGDLIREPENRNYSERIKREFKAEYAHKNYDPPRLAEFLSYYQTHPLLRGDGIRPYNSSYKFSRIVQPGSSLGGTYLYGGDWTSIVTDPKDMSRFTGLNGAEAIRPLPVAGVVEPPLPRLPYDGPTLARPLPPLSTDASIAIPVSYVKENFSKFNRNTHLLDKTQVRPCRRLGDENVEYPPASFAQIESFNSSATRPPSCVSTSSLLSETTKSRLRTHPPDFDEIPIFGGPQRQWKLKSDGNYGALPNGKSLKADSRPLPLHPRTDLLPYPTAIDDEGYLQTSKMMMRLHSADSNTLKRTSSCGVLQKGRVTQQKWRNHDMHVAVHNNKSRIWKHEPIDLKKNVATIEREWRMKDNFGTDGKPRVSDDLVFPVMTIRDAVLHEDSPFGTSMRTALPKAKAALDVLKAVRCDDQLVPKIVQVKNL